MNIYVLFRIDDEVGEEEMLKAFTDQSRAQEVCHRMNENQRAVEREYFSTKKRPLDFKQVRYVVDAVFLET